MEKATFTENEKLMLIQLIAEESIIENKKTDGALWKKKNEAWERVANAYNSQGFRSRTSKQLKKCWENIKQRKRKRKSNTALKQDRLQTGGGYVETAYDPVLELVEIAAPHVDVELPCKWVSTATFIEQNIPKNSNDSTYEKQEAGPSFIDDIYESSQSLPSKKNKEVLQCPNDGSSYQPKNRTTSKDDSKTEYQRLLLKKVAEQIQQDKEWHEMRMATARLEYKIAELRLKKLKEELGEDIEMVDQ